MKRNNLVAMMLLPTLLSACGGAETSSTQTAPSQSAAAAEPGQDASTASPALPATGDQSSTKREPDVIYVPTPQPVVDRMLELAKLQPGDVLYDLGSGDGRIPVTAAKKYGVRAVGIDINPERIAEANANAKVAGVTDKVSFIEADLFLTDIAQADVVTLYLLQSLNVKLRPKLLAELKPGTRIISHSFDMAEEWEPEHTEKVDSNTIYMWTVPDR